jgi:hypothetical protein
MMMKNKGLCALVVGTLTILLPAMTLAQTADTYKYTPESPSLYDTIVHMDSVYFNAYNSCDMTTQAAIYSDSLEFYHDKGGLQTSKQAVLDAIRRNICGKVTRVLVKGSIEVYPIAGFGAIEIGLHRFINHQESETPSKPDKFIMIWRHSGNRWQITRVISLH